MSDRVQRRATGHRLMSVAAVLGFFFVILHLVTIAVTCVAEGFDWGLNAWALDLMGLAASAFFAVQCSRSSKHRAIDSRHQNQWIFVWAVATLCVRAVDVPMLLGWIRWDSIYVTPTGWIFWANVVSEIIVGVFFNLAALVGSILLLKKAGEPT